ncbi:MAG: hypothetical protein VZR02_01110 [Lachnospiraceae bacterium]|nr:hypothetical protein [Lachnospiraceae bacterium]
MDRRNPKQNILAFFYDGTMKRFRSMTALVLAVALTFVLAVPCLTFGETYDSSASASVSQNAVTATRDIYFVDRTVSGNSLWNAEDAGSSTANESSIWVQHMKEPTSGYEYAFAGDGKDAGEEEVRMEDTGSVDTSGDRIYRASIPESWSYIAFSYFEGMDPENVPSNPLHRTLLIKVDDEERYVVKTVQENGTAWSDEVITKTSDGNEAFYIDDEVVYADGAGYRKPAAEKIEIRGEVTSPPTPTPGSSSWASSSSGSTEGTGVTETPTPEVTVTPTETVSKNEIITPATKESEITPTPTESVSENGIAQNRKVIRKAASVSNGKTIYFWAVKSINNYPSWQGDTFSVYYYSTDSANRLTPAKIPMTQVEGEFETVDSSNNTAEIKVFKATIPADADGIVIRSYAYNYSANNGWKYNNADYLEQTQSLTSVEDGNIYYLEGYSVSEDGGNKQKAWSIHSSDLPKTIDDYTLRLAKDSWITPSHVTINLKNGTPITATLNLNTGKTFTYDKITWSTTDSSIATVDPETADVSSKSALTASVTGLKAGTTTLTASLYNGSDIVTSATADVKVYTTYTTVYYDATFSKLQYSSNDTRNTSMSIPKSDGTIKWYAKNSEGTDLGNGTMTPTTASGNVTGTWNDIYVNSTDLPAGTTQVYFANSSNYKTDCLTIPDDLTTPCFYADTGDDVVYTGSDRGGYWGEAWQTRKAEDHTDAVPATNSDSGTMPKDGDKETNAENKEVFNVTSTFYDYLSDYELNGKSRASYQGADGRSHRNWVIFREFNQALSDYYRTNSISYPMYTGHFQPKYYQDYGSNGSYSYDSTHYWGTAFSEIGTTLGLMGNTSDSPGSTFYAINNSNPHTGSSASSVVSDVHTTGLYNYATQGLMDASDVKSTFFNESFLTENNSKHAKLANVYKNVSFPMYKTTEYAAKSGGSDQVGSDYYVFDSASDTVHLATDGGSYYLKNTGNQRWSMNVNSSGETSGVSNTYGFFPLDDTTADGTKKANQHNYGFGAVIDVPFTLNEKGTIVKDGKEVPQVFKFSGDDDIWVEVDGKLVLDMGGDHGRVDGAINFALADTSYDYVKFGSSDWEHVPHQSTYLSKVKYVSGISPKTDTGTGSSDVTGQTLSVSSALSGLTVTKDGETKYDPTVTHHLTVYYMERGMWESNMKMEMNFTPQPSTPVTIDVGVKTNNEPYEAAFALSGFAGYIAYRKKKKREYKDFS